MMNRTYSSPNLKDRSSPSSRSFNERQSQREELNLMDLFGEFFSESHKSNLYDIFADETFYVVGDRVYVDGNRAASVAYFGEVDFAPGDWVGVVLDERTGNHDGKLHGREYFQCAPLHGLFVRLRRVSRMPDSALGSSAASSRNPTPMPTTQRLGARSCSRSPGATSSAMDSYYYDEDYRQPQQPSASSLLQKLQSIERQHGLSPSGKRAQSILKPNRDARLPHDRGDSNQCFSDQLDSRSPVLHFRPKRAPLDELDEQVKAQKVNIVSETPKKGDSVLIRTDRGDVKGVLRFLGETDFATGDWAGVELDDPEGRNDGSILGRRYFHCPQNYGLFVPAVRIRKYKPNLKDEKPWRGLSESMRHTITSPPPRQYFDESSCSTTPSYGRDSSMSTSSWFTDSDIEFEIKKSLNKQVPSSMEAARVQSSNIDPVRPKSVKYTFLSSKYDGNPIVRKVVQYD